MSAVACAQSTVTSSSGMHTTPTVASRPEHRGRSAASDPTLGLRVPDREPVLERPLPLLERGEGERVALIPVTTVSVTHTASQPTKEARPGTQAGTKLYKRVYDNARGRTAHAALPPTPRVAGHMVGHAAEHHTETLGRMPF